MFLLEMYYFYFEAELVKLCAFKFTNAYINRLTINLLSQSYINIKN